MREDQGGTKAQAWGCPRHHQEIFKKSLDSKLGDAQGIHFFINNHEVLLVSLYFIPLPIMCYSWSVFLFCFQFCFVFFAGLK